MLTGFRRNVLTGQHPNPKPCLQAQERQKAELHFKLAMALQFAEKPEQALTEVKVGAACRALPSHQCCFPIIMICVGSNLHGAIQPCLHISCCHIIAATIWLCGGLKVAICILEGCIDRVRQQQEAPAEGAAPGDGLGAGGAPLQTPEQEVGSFGFAAQQQPASVSRVLPSCGADA